MDAIDLKADPKIVKRATANNPAKGIKWQHKQYATNSREGRIKGKRERTRLDKFETDRKMIKQLYP